MDWHGDGSIVEGERWSCSSSVGLKSGYLKSVEVEIIWNPQSVPFFLKRVLMEDLGAQHLINHKSLLENAVHAVLLDSGFVRIYSDSVPGVHFKSRFYTLPEILQNLGGSSSTGSRSSNTIIESIGLRFQSLGHFVNVYGYLIGGDSVYRVSLEAHKVASIIEFVWASRINVNDIVKVGLLETQETKIFDFWKTIKDGIALPLMIDLCAKAGLPSPPCLMSLPPELKAKILKSLCGVDIAKIECTCRELRQLGNDDELWWNKLAYEFPGLWNEDDNDDMVGGTKTWKTVYGDKWRQHKYPWNPRNKRSFSHANWPNSVQVQELRPLPPSFFTYQYTASNFQQG
ncbi:F-box protein SKIP22-like [Rosa sericea]